MRIIISPNFTVSVLPANPLKHPEGIIIIVDDHDGENMTHFVNSKGREYGT